MPPLQKQCCIRKSSMFVLRAVQSTEVHYVGGMLILLVNPRGTLNNRWSLKYYSRQHNILL